MTRNTGSTEEARFNAALTKHAELVEFEPPSVAAACHTRLMQHGAPTERSYLLLHGFTNCPAEWDLVASDLYDKGANVVAPLAPAHGRSDLSPEELSTLTAEKIADWTRAWTDVASGLASRVAVVGFSFGGVCAAWAACNLDAVDEAVLVAPAFLPRGLPSRLGAGLPHYIRAAADRYVWWDPIRRERMVASPYTYRRLSTRGIGAVFDLGQRVWRSTPSRTRQLEHAACVLNARDPAISAPAAEAAFRSALVPLAAHSEIVRLGAGLRLPHDFIDPLGGIGAREPQTRSLLLAVITGEDLSEPEVGREKL